MIYLRRFNTAIESGENGFSGRMWLLLHNNKQFFKLGYLKQQKWYKGRFIRILIDCLV